MAVRIGAYRCSHSVVDRTAGWPGPLHGGRSADAKLRPPILTEPLARASRTSNGNAADSSHQLLNENENENDALADSTGPSAPTGR